MTLSTLYPWCVQLAERPYPAPLGEHVWSALTIGQRLGFNALECMIAARSEVGPVVCNAHSVLHIPVSSRHADHLLSSRAELRPRDVSCTDRRFEYGPCPGRFWMMPPDYAPTAPVLSDFTAFYDCVYRYRATRSRAA